MPEHSQPGFLKSSRRHDKERASGFAHLKSVSKIVVLSYDLSSTFQGVANKTSAEMMEQAWPHLFCNDAVQSRRGSKGHLPADLLERL
jgi:hypothetical protein